MIFIEGSKNVDAENLSRLLGITTVDINYSNLLYSLTKKLKDSYKNETTYNMFKDIHNELEHPGITSNYNEVNKSYYMITRVIKLKQIEEIIINYKICQIIKHYRLNKCLVLSIIMSKKPLKVISSDICVPYNLKIFNEVKIHYVITFTTIFSRLTIIDTIYNIEAKKEIK